LVDLVRIKASHFDRCVYDDQFLELDFKFGQVPLALFLESIDGKPQRPQLNLRQLINLGAWDDLDTKKFRSFHLNETVDNAIVLVDQYGHAKTECLNRPRHRPHVSRVLATDGSAQWAQLLNRNIDQREWRD
jgi:hypothetical protein